MSTDTMILGTHEHYLTSNGVRTFVGPVRHRASRKLDKVRAAFAARLNRSNRSTPEEKTVQPLGNNDVTAIIPAQRQRQTVDPNATTANIGNLGAQVTKMLEGLKVPTFTVNGIEPEGGHKGRRRRPSWVAQAKEAVMDRLYDSAWHEMVQNTCKTVGWVGMTTASVVVFGKALVWVVLL